MDNVGERKISRETRKKMARAAKRTQKKRMIAKKRKEKRRKNPGQLRQIAQKQAKNLIVKKMTGGKKYSDLPVTAKEKIEKQLAKKPGLIARVAKKLMPRVKANEKERIKRVRAKSKPNPLTEVVDPLTIASIVGITGGAVAITATLAKKLADAFSNKSVKFDVGKTYDLIKKKYPHIFTMIKDQKFGKGHLAKFINKIKDEIPGLDKRKSLYATTNIIDQLMKYHISHALGINDPQLDPDRFKNESKEGKHGVLTLSVDGSQPEVSARYVDGKLEPYVFNTQKDAKKHTDKVGGKPYESSDTGKFYVEFTRLDGPVNEKIEYKTANEIKKQWKQEYPNDKFTFKKVRAKGNEFLMVLSPKGVELERYQFVPKTGWTEMNENKDNEEDVKELKAMLDIAKMLSDKSPYFKGRGSKKEYIKMLVHKIQKLSEAKKQKLMTKMDAYKKVRKPTMPKSRPMKNKKAYDRKDLKKGKYD